MPEKLNDAEILEAWHINAKPWIKAIENSEIESRKLVTNKAIIDAITEIAPHNILDIGCGEGWLSAELASKGIEVSGVDAVPELIEKAKQIPGKFEVCAYEDLSDYKFEEKFDCAVCNFSLIGKESTEAVIKAVPKFLEPDGCFIIQTLHPVFACGDKPYEDGWRKGSWAGFSSDFTKPAPWYFRTIESWHNLFAINNLKITKVIEPLHPNTEKPASIIFELSL